MSPLIYKSRPGNSPTSAVALFVHGRAGSLSVMSTFTRAVPEDWHIVFVQAPIADPIGGFSWWDINDSLTREAQRAASLQLLTDFVLEYPNRVGLSPERMFAFGFSQGAALLSVIMQRTPEIFSGVALLSGFVIQQDQIGHGPHPDVFIAHGTDDQVITIEHALEGARFLEDHGFAITMHTENVGHKVGIEGMRALKRWVAEQTARC